MKKINIGLIALSLFLSQKSFSQFYSISSNLVEDATLNLNAEVSMALNRKTTIHFPIIFNPFVYNSDELKNKKFQNLTVMPGFRFWFKDSYTYNFIGAYAIASRYHISNIWDNKRYDGYAMGVGASYGHSYDLAKNWNFEWEVGAGLVYAFYDKYKCKQCGSLISTEKKWLIIPTKLSFSIVYLF